MIDVSIRLRRAIIIDDLLLVKRILKNTPHALHNPDLTSNTSLHLSSSTGSLSITVYLITQGHERSGISRNAEGDTPLMVACAANQEDVVRYLVRMFPRCVNWKNKAGLTAMMHAARCGNDGVVHVLLDEGQADINAVDNVGCGALHYASAYGHLKVIRSLIERGADPDKLNKYQWEPKDYSFTHAALQYFDIVIAEKERDTQEKFNTRTRAATPVFGRSERAALPVRQRASSGS